MAKCSECNRKKELTLHGTCWPCHLGSVSLNTHIIARIPSGNRFKDYANDLPVTILSGPDAGKTFA